MFLKYVFILLIENSIVSKYLNILANNFNYNKIEKLNLC